MSVFFGAGTRTLSLLSLLISTGVSLLSSSFAALFNFGAGFGVGGGDGVGSTSTGFGLGFLPRCFGGGFVIVLDTTVDVAFFALPNFIQKEFVLMLK